MWSGLKCKSWYIHTTSVAELERVVAEVFGWSRRRFKILAVAGVDTFGQHRLLFLASEKGNELKLFIVLCILYIFCIINCTC